jgi:hypothetical protein
VAIIRKGRRLKLKEEAIIKIMSRVKHRIFPRPFERLGVTELNIKKNLIGVEVGVHEGDHALSLLENLDIKKLYLIDPWEYYKEYEGDYKGYMDVQITGLPDAEKVTRRRMIKYENQVEIIKSFSSKCLNQIPDNLDFVYIDANHNYKFITEDMRNFWKKVRVGGIMGGHDYYNGYQRMCDDVIRAVGEFAYENKLQLRVETPDWWFVKKK